MAIITSISIVQLECNDLRPEFRDIAVSAGDAGWDEDVNFNTRILGRGDHPMRWPFRVGITESTIDATFTPKEYNSSLVLINDTIDGLSVYIQSNDSVGVWVKKT